MSVYIYFLFSFLADEALNHLLAIAEHEKETPRSIIENDFSPQNGVNFHQPSNLLDQFSGNDSSKTFNYSSSFLQHNQNLSVSEKLKDDKLNDGIIY